MTSRADRERAAELVFGPRAEGWSARVESWVESDCEPPPPCEVSFDGLADILAAVRTEALDSAIAAVQSITTRLSPEHLQEAITKGDVMAVVEGFRATAVSAIGVLGKDGGR